MERLLSEWNGSISCLVLKNKKGHLKTQEKDFGIE